MAYEDAIAPINKSAVRQDARTHIKRLIRSLIAKNSSPREQAVFGGAKRLASVDDVLVHTFYVVYSSRDGDYGRRLGTLPVDAMSIEIAREMIAEGVYEPYFKARLGKPWEAAELMDKAAKNDAERVKAIIDFKLMQIIITHGPGDPKVVARPNRLAEISRLRHSGGLDRVYAIGQLRLSGAGRVNVHMRETVKNYDQVVAKNICILEGRNDEEFVIGPNTYDDIIVEGIRDQYRMIVSANHDGLVNVELFNGRNKPELPRRESVWTLGGAQLQFIRTARTRLDLLTLYEAPPVIAAEGRVLAESSLPGQPVPQALSAHYGQDVTRIHSWVSLDDSESLFLFAYESQVRLLSKAKSTRIRVLVGGVPATINSDESFTVENNSEIEVSDPSGSRNYRWYTRPNTLAGLPLATLGLLEQRAAEQPAASMPDPEQSLDKNQRWMLGRWRSDPSPAAAHNATAILPETCDALLSHQGSLWLEWAGRDGRCRAQFRANLRAVGEIPFYVKPYGETWRKVDWPNAGQWQPEPTRNGSIAEVYPAPGVTFCCIESRLIFGSTCYVIKTCQTP